jgi:hypothetical protein
MQNGGAAHSDADSGGATSLLDMCYQTIVLLNGEYEGMRAAKDNPQSFQRRLRVRDPADCLGVSRPRASASSCRSTCSALLLLCLLHVARDRRASRTTWTRLWVAMGCCISHLRLGDLRLAARTQQQALETAQAARRSRQCPPACAHPAVCWSLTRRRLNCGVY